jgi:ribosomal protein S27E
MTNSKADATADCPGSGQRGQVVFSEPGDDWYVKCPVCGMTWAGGSDVIDPHRDSRTR